MDRDALEQAKKLAKRINEPLTPGEAKRQAERWAQLTPSRRERLVPSDPENFEIVSGQMPSAILFSAKNSVANVDDARDHLAVHKELYWAVPFRIKKQFSFPIDGLIHITGVGVEYRVTISVSFLSIRRTTIVRTLNQNLGETAGNTTTHGERSGNTNS